MSEQRTIASPNPNAETQKYWDAAAEGKLLIQKCKDTGKFFCYPRARSPFTLSDNVEWVEAKGTGEVYTFSVMKRSKTPYAIAYVRLDEGVTMMTNIVDTDLDAIKIGQKVKVVFKPTEDGPPVPMFTPA
ncbi:MAG TPA: Zn-ribbon domain-containing OB-fold protein [Hyphomicrobiaceae bacterium]|nr:Zn-ribbon domain-containing OB-fold protein [Hyphomicrobiaceae bacterium]